MSKQKGTTSESESVIIKLNDYGRLIMEVSQRDVATESKTKRLVELSCRGGPADASVRMCPDEAEELRDALNEFV